MNAAKAVEIHREHERSNCYQRRKDAITNIKQHLDDGCAKTYNSFLSGMANQFDKDSTDGMSCAMSDILSLVHATFDDAFGRESDKSKFFKKNGKALVVQETVISEMEGKAAFVGYRTSSGKFAGLNIRH